MLQTSDKYKTQINAPGRKFQCKVIVHFNPPLNPVTFKGEDLSAINCLLEAKGENNNPLGVVTANELTIKFINEDKKFTPSNTNGPYYGQLKQGIKVEVFLGLELSSNVEWIPLGVYWTGDWQAPSNSSIATATCYDRLYKIGELDTPLIGARADISVAELFGILFTKLGLSSSEYWIDSTISTAVKVGYLPAGKVRSTLQTLSLAGMCNVYTDRTGKIIVRNMYQMGQPAITISDDDQIISSENPQQFSSIYSAVKITYKTPTVKENQTLLDIQDFAIPAGQTSYENVLFNNVSAYRIKSIKLIGTNNTTLQIDRYSTEGVSFTLYNTGEAEVAQLQVIGDIVSYFEANHIVQDDVAVGEFGYKELVINNEFLQTLKAAQEYAEMLIHYVTNIRDKFNLTIRGNPAMEIYDLFNIQDVSGKIDGVLVSLSKIELEWNGVLSSRIEARAPIAPKTWTMVSPGLFIETYYNYS